MTKHHELAPSSFPAWEVCPAFTSDPAPRADAAAGTAQHEALAALLTGKEEPLRGLSPEGREAVRWAATYIHQLAGDDPIKEETRLQYTTPDAFSESGESVVFFGTADALIIHPPGNMADLIDYKSGADDHTHRPQLAGYALALFSMRSRIKTVRCHVLYGRVRHVDSWTLTQSEAAGVVLPILRARMAENRPPQHCAYCTFCSHKLTCPAITGAVQVVAESQDRADLAPLVCEPNAITDPNLMAHVMDLARTVSTWATAARKAATEMANKGAVIPGYRLQTRSGKKEVTDLSAAMERTGLPSETFLAACKLSIPQLARTLAETRDITKKAATTELDELLAGLIDEGKPSVSLVVDSRAES